MSTIRIGNGMKGSTRVAKRHVGAMGGRRGGCASCRGKRK